MQLCQVDFYHGCVLVYIKENSLLAKLAAMKLKAAKIAIVFGNTIYLHHTSREEFVNDQRWLCHELKHVEQYRQFGFIGFLTRYILESLRKGYYRNKFEVEARNAEADLYLLEHLEIR
jgi:hypothetical protein